MNNPATESMESLRQAAGRLLAGMVRRAKASGDRPEPIALRLVAANENTGSGAQEALHAAGRVAGGEEIAGSGILRPAHELRQAVDTDEDGET